MPVGREVDEEPAQEEGHPRRHAEPELHGHQTQRRTGEGGDQGGRHRSAASGNTIFTEHTERWHFHSGEESVLQVVSNHVFENGKIKLWRDYWDLAALMSTAPAWWIEGLARHADLKLA